MDLVEAKPKLNFHILMVYLQSLKGLKDELYDGVNQRRDGPLVQFFCLSVMTVIKLNVTSVAQVSSNQNRSETYLQCLL